MTEVKKQNPEGLESEAKSGTSLEINDGELLEVVESLRRGKFEEFTQNTFKVTDPFNAGKNDCIVMVVERIKKELADKDVFISKLPNNKLARFNGVYWEVISQEDFKDFLAACMIALGYGFEKAAYYTIKDGLLKQFENRCAKLNEACNDKILINFENGTLEIGEEVLFREFSKDDGITYNLPFSYDPKSTCPRFSKFLNEVLPDVELQKVISEFFGSTFIDNKKLKLEKVLLLYGRGSNGKSVIFEIMQRLFGSDNFSTFSLESLTDKSGYSRAKLEGKLINYASEISGDVNAGKFKQLTSGESIEVRLPYKAPYTLEKIPKLAFNINEFPKNVEKTEAFFRRLLIVPFNTIITKDMQDKQLASKIIDTELSGIFNWVIEGMIRLKSTGDFTQSNTSDKVLSEFRLESDSVASFIEDKGILASDTDTITLKSLYEEFSRYNTENGFKKISSSTLKKRLANLGIKNDKKNIGVVVFAKRPTSKIVEGYKI